jgi:hypothetical protein
MYDTVVASIEWPHSLKEDLFQGGQLTSDLHGVDVLRMWINPTGDYGPRVTYWRRVGDVGGRLRVEFSIPKMAGIGAYDNPSEQDATRALGDTSAYVRMLFGSEFPHLRTWQVSRVDYAWNWRVGEHLPLYMSLLQSLWLGGMSRHPYPDTQGIVWQSKARWVKFYDKQRQLGRIGSGDVLRFEVSNFKRSLPYLCERIFGCTRTVGEVLHPGRALYVMASQFEKLGLADAKTYGGDSASLLLRLRKSFGNAAPGALYALQAIHAYGADAHRQYGLMSKGSYYTWSKRLREHGYMTEHSSDVLAALHLPTHVVSIDDDLARSGQNLGDGDGQPAKIDQKILWKNLAKTLGVREKAKPSAYLLHKFAHNLYGEVDEAA